MAGRTSNRRFPGPPPPHCPNAPGPSAALFRHSPDFPGIIPAARESDYRRAPGTRPNAAGCRRRALWMGWVAQAWLWAYENWRLAMRPGQGPRVGPPRCHRSARMFRRAGSGKYLPLATIRSGRKRRSINTAFVVRAGAGISGGRPLPGPPVTENPHAAGTMDGIYGDCQAWGPAVMEFLLFPR